MEGLYNHFQERAAEIKRESNHATSQLADEIKLFVEEENPLSDSANMYSDLLQAAIDSADFHFIADNFLEEIEDEEEIEE